jgi:hypothetical protein
VNYQIRIWLHSSEVAVVARRRGRGRVKTEQQLRKSAGSLPWRSIHRTDKDKGYTQSLSGGTERGHRLGFDVTHVRNANRSARSQVRVLSRPPSESQLFVAHRCHVSFRYARALFSRIWSGQQSRTALPGWTPGCTSVLSRILAKGGFQAVNHCSVGMAKPYEVIQPNSHFAVHACPIARVSSIQH